MNSNPTYQIICITVENIKLTIQRIWSVSPSALAKWIKRYSEAQIDEDTVITAKQIRELQKQNALLEEENLILKKQLTSSRHTRRMIKGCTPS